MDTRQIEYILMIAQENNITRAAEKLFISQSALNQQLLKLEKELGCQLFHRSRTNWRPTEEGKIYIEGAEKIMMVKKETYAKIQDCLHEGIATLDVGLTPGRGFRMFTAIYPALHEKYPGLIVTPVEMNVQRQQEAIAKGQLDIGFVTAAVKEKPMTIIWILERKSLYWWFRKKVPLVLKSRTGIRCLSLISKSWRTKPSA